LSKPQPDENVVNNYVEKIYSGISSFSSSLSSSEVGLNNILKAEDKTGEYTTLLGRLWGEFKGSLENIRNFIRSAIRLSNSIIKKLFFLTESNNTYMMESNKIVSLISNIKEKTLSMIKALFDRLVLKATFVRIKNMLLEIKKRPFHFLLNVVIGILSFKAVGYLNGFLEAYLKHYAVDILGFFGMSVKNQKTIEKFVSASILMAIAPVVEEIYKFVSIKITKSETPAFITFVLEFRGYMGRVSGSIHFYILSLIGRLYTLDFHSNTIRRVSEKRRFAFLRNVGEHMAWNTFMEKILNSIAWPTYKFVLYSSIDIFNKIYNALPKGGRDFVKSVIGTDKFVEV